MERTQEGQPPVRERADTEVVLSPPVSQAVLGEAEPSREELEAQEDYRRAIRVAARTRALERNGFDRAGSISEEDAKYLGYSQDGDDDPNFVSPAEHYEVIFPDGRI